MSRLAALLPKLAVFAVTAALSGIVASVAVAAVQDRTPQSTAGTAPAYLLLGADTPAGPGVTVAFNEPPAAQGQPSSQPSPLPTLAPADLQAAAASLLGGKPVSWVNPTGFPRVPPVSQFDGGPLQGFNCTMASGAMLARLGYGIVTTGSTLRSLQPDQEGGTSLNDLANALWHGYGVSFPFGLIHPAQLKALLAAGYGAVVQGLYGDVPPGLRLQQDFTGGHAIYLDGYYPGSATSGIPEAYYVIDPLGHPWAGYEGDWWPASVVDAFMAAWAGGDRVAAMWAFPPGGTPPDVVGPDVLPIPPDATGPSASPTPGPSGSPAESGSPAPSGSPGPTASPGETPAPTPTPAPIGPPQPGDNPPVIPSNLLTLLKAEQGGILLMPVFDICLGASPPSGCPPGIPATVTINFSQTIFPPPGPSIDVLFADSTTPNVAMVGFTVDPATPADVKFWKTGVSPGVVQTASAMTTFPWGGKTVVLARLDVLAGTAYQFQVVAGSGISSSVSPVGSFTTGPGVAQFDVSLGAASSPAFKLGSGLSPYLHPLEGAYALPMTPMSTLGSTACTDTVTIGGTSFCLDQAVIPAPASCTRAQVTYALSGIDATGVTVRAFPVGGGMSLDGVIEVAGPSPSGSVSVGCLTSGLSYTIALDATGDASGVLAQKTITVP